MRKKKKNDELDITEEEKKVRDSFYYHNIIVKTIIALLIVFICYFSYYVYILNDEFINVYLESLFKAFFFIVLEIVMLLYKDNNSKSFGVLTMINSYLIITITLLFGKHEILYILLALVLLINSIIFLHKFKKEEHSEEDVRDKRIYVALTPVFFLLAVFLAFDIFKPKIIFSIIIGLIFMSSFGTAFTVICFKYLKKKKFLLILTTIVFSLIYLAFGVLTFLK